MHGEKNSVCYFELVLAAVSISNWFYLYELVSFFYLTFFLFINLLVKLYTFISKQCSKSIPAMHGGGSSVCYFELALAAVLNSVLVSILTIG